jgi:hypothetical protein
MSREDVVVSYLDGVRVSAARFRHHLDYLLVGALRSEDDVVIAYEI